MTLLDDETLQTINAINIDTMNKTTRVMRMIGGPPISRCKNMTDLQELAKFAYYIYRLKMMSEKDYHDYVDELTMIGFMLFNEDGKAKK